MNIIDSFFRNKYEIEHWRRLVQWLTNNMPLMDHVMAAKAESFKTFDEIQQYIGNGGSERVSAQLTCSSFQRFSADQQRSGNGLGYLRVALQQ
jgi:hypothetical protein